MSKCIDCGKVLAPISDGSNFPKGIQSCRAYRKWAEEELAAGRFNLGTIGTPETFQAAWDLFVQMCEERQARKLIAANN